MIRDAQTRSGIFPVKLAWENQKPLPITDKINIHIDMSSVIFVLIALISCGKKMIVVKTDANQPYNSAIFINKKYL